jgi:hypothetical protein
MDQAGPLRALMARNPAFLASYDLSAATDRLPIALQIQVLSQLVDSEFASA